jgi:3'-5' exoribonuclease 1
LTPSRMETIEVGAVMLASAGGPVLREFNAFVRPIESLILSDFCLALTSIRQDDVDAACVYPVVLEQLLNWAGSSTPFIWCSWGAYDLKQLRSDCRRHGISFPAALEPHINLKREFARLTGDRPRTMKEALRLKSIPLQGRHHRGIDDARNIAVLACWILPQLVPECGTSASRQQV